MSGAFLTMVELMGIEPMCKNDRRYGATSLVPPGYDAARDRKVLVHGRELNRLAGKTHEQGLTLVPISVYTRAALVKLEFALARGKKQYEKRELLKKRDVERELRARMKE